MRVRIVLAVLLLMCAVLPLAEALPVQFVETFTATTYRDASTTADWNTTAGRLQPPQPDANLPLSAVATDVAIAGDHAYVGTESGMSVVDISNPFAPVLVGSLAGGSSRRLDVDGNYAYLATASGLRIIDISDPTNPTLVSTDGPRNVRDVVVQGTIAYIADFNVGLVLLDISDRTSPVELGSYSATGINGIDVSGNRAYITTANQGMVIVSVDPPSSPYYLGNVFIGSVTPIEIDVNGDDAWVVDTNGLTAFTLNNPSSISNFERYNPPDPPTDVLVVGNVAYVTDVSGVRAISLDNPFDISQSALVGALDEARGLDMSGRYLWFADGSAGLSMHALGGDWMSPPVYSGQNIPNWVFDPSVAVSGEYAYVGGNYILAPHYLQIFNITDADTVVSVGGASTFSEITDIAVQGFVAAAATHDGSDIFWDVTNPATPYQMPFTIYAPGGLKSVFLAGNHAYFGGNDRLYVFNITMLPNNFAGADTVFLSQPAWDVHVDGDVAYVANDTTGLVTFDVSVPTTVTALDTFPTAPDAVTKVVVDGNTAYMVRGTALEIVDVTDPANLSVLGAVSPTSNPIADLVVDGDRAYLAIPAEGVAEIDVSDPTNPVHLTTSGPAAEALAMAGESIYLAGDQWLDRATVRVPYEGGDFAQSTSVIVSADSLYAARLLATTTGEVDFELTPDGGTTWIPVTPGTDLFKLSPAGTDLRWRCTLQGGDPAVDDVTIQWRYDFPLIASVHDVPGDQGGSVHMTWYPSPREAVNQGAQITEYTAWRAIDPMTAAALKESGAAFLPSAGTLPKESTKPVYRQSRVGTQDFFWELVGTQQAFFRPGYSMTIPTLYDSSAVVTDKHYFQVVAHTVTPAVFYESPVDSGYSVDNLAPAAPQGVAGQASYGPTALTISWSPNTEPDLAGYNVYRGTSPDFTVDIGSFLASTADTVSTDFDWTPGAEFYYKLRAVDIHGNESLDAVLAPDIVSEADTSPPAWRTSVNVYPNPFNPSTTVSYSLAAAGEVTVTVYDVQGRLVDTLVEREWHEPGEYRMPYRAGMSTGVYFLRLSAGKATVTKKMVLVK